MLKRRRPVALLLGTVAVAVLSLAFAQPGHAATPSGGPFIIKNVGSGMCIQTDPSNNGPDIQLVQEPCTSSTGSTAAPAQQWFIDPLGNGNVHIVNGGTFNCMRALSNTDFAEVQTIDCTTISDEVFSIGNTSAHQIFSHISGGNRCLDVQEGSMSPGGVIDIFHCTSNNISQLFFIQ